MRPASSFATLVFVVILAGGVAFTYAMFGISVSWESNWPIIVAFVLATVAFFAIKVADQWNRAVVLRLGRFHAQRGPGLFFIIPIIDTDSLLDRHPRDHERVQGGKNPYQGHGAGGCRCRSVLEGRRP